MKEIQAAEARIFNLSEVSEEPTFIKSGTPHYPEMARLMGAQAKIILRLVIDEVGDVRSVQVIYSSAPKFRSAFEQSAIKAAKQYKYKPAIVDGKPVPCWAKVIIKFKLN
ncbi:energy transducer TonB [bacterium]|nr:energy transducer TonB [bacterium]